MCSSLIEESSGNGIGRCDIYTSCWLLQDRISIDHDNK